MATKTEKSDRAHESLQTNCTGKEGIIRELQLKDKDAGLAHKRELKPLEG
jgi:hypothetical protein